MSSVSVVKLGTWGGDLGSAFDLTVAPQRLESFTVRWGKVIDWIAFSYRDRDGKLHTAGPWGGNGEGEGTETITLQPSEYVMGVSWSVGPFAFENVERCITKIKLVTNLGSYGPFGHGVDSTHHDLPVLNGSVVGMFARAGDFLDAIGFYVLPGGPAATAAAVPAAPATATTDPVIKEEKAEEEKVVDDGSSQEEIKEEKSSQEEKKEEEEKSSQEGKEEKGNSSQEEKENGKS